MFINLLDMRRGVFERRGLEKSVVFTMCFLLFVAVCVFAFLFLLLVLFRVLFPAFKTIGLEPPHSLPLTTGVKIKQKNWSLTGT